jgi:glycosyltransferase involved in cell wall biosynthesis
VNGTSPSNHFDGTQKTVPKTPTVSICIPAYNYGRFVSTAIESALHQTMAPCEVLVSDNWSTDNTHDVLQRYASSVRIVKPEKHLSIGDHYLFMAEQARGDYIAPLSADDALHPCFIAAIASYLGKYTMVGTGRFDCDSRMKPFAYSGLTYCFRKSTIAGQLFPFFVKGCRYTMAATAIDRPWFLELPRVPPEANHATDWFVALMTSAYRLVAMLPAPRYYFRCHEANAAEANPDRERRQVKAILDWLASSSLLEGEYLRAVQTKQLAFGKQDDTMPGGARRMGKIALSWLMCHAYRHPAYLR